MDDIWQYIAVLVIGACILVGSCVKITGDIDRMEEERKAKQEKEENGRRT